MPTDQQTKENKRDGLDYANFIVLFLVLVATACAAIYTKKLAVDGERNAQKQLRAYVYAVPYPTIDSVGAGRHPETLVRFRNSGQTPAHDLSSLAEWGIRRYPILPDNDFSIPLPPGTQFAKIVLNPGTEPNVAATFRKRESLTPNERERVRSGDKERFYVWGTVVYRDIYERWHYANFCFSYYGDGETLAHAEYCPQHNDAGDGRPTLGKPTSDLSREIMIIPALSTTLSGGQIMQK